MTAPKPPDRLVDHIKQGKCVVFVGAGLSMQAGLPSWKGLLEEVVERLDNLQERETNELSVLLERGKLLEVAEYCKHKDVRHFNSILKGLLRGDQCELPEAHRILARIPFAGVVTTNYDKLIERGWHEEKRSEPLVLTHSDAQALGELLISGDEFLLKAHGDIDRTESIVLTAMDYREIIHGDTAFESVFSAILMTRVVLFLGYSLGDPDFKLMIEAPLQRFEGIVAPRFALMTGMGEIERNLMGSTWGVNVIPYENTDGRHAEVAGFLERLEKATTGEAIRPVERAVARPVATPSRPAERPEEVPTLTVQLDGSEIRSSFLPGRGLAPSAVGSGPPPEWQELRGLLRRELVEKSSLDLPSLAAVGAALTSFVHPAVIDRLAGLQEGSDVELALSSGLQNLPWEWLQLPTGAEGSSFLAGHLSSFRHPYGTRLPGVGSSRFGIGGTRILLIADPEASDAGVQPLEGALQECKEIKALVERDDTRDAKVELLAREEASYENLAECLRSGVWDIVHFAGHAWADAQSSYLILAGGEVLRPADLSYLIRSRPPALLFLNSHFTSFVLLGMEERLASRYDSTSTGSGHSGFSLMASKTGVGAFIGTSHDALSDQGAQRLAVGFYEELLRETPVARALWSAAGRLSVEAGGSACEQLFYAVFGGGREALPRGHAFQTK